jgi:branched-chain amino acid transport system substrate-binding protein
MNFGKMTYKMYSPILGTLSQKSELERIIELEIIKNYIYMNKKVFITIGVIAVVAIGVLVYLNKKDKNENVVKVGVILPLTGDVATYGKSVQEGLDIAVDELGKNAKFKYELVYQDSKAQAGVSLSAVEYLTSQGIKFFIGDATSTVTYWS